MANKRSLSEGKKETGLSRLGSWGGQSPLREITRLQRGMERLFDDFLTPFSTSYLWGGEDLVSVPACDIEETDTHYLLSFDLPGISKDDVKIDVRDSQLIVSGYRKEEKVSRLNSERFYGVFQRSFTLPIGINVDQVEASYKDGVLWIAVPKGEVAKGKTIEIKEGKGGVLSRLLGQEKEIEKEGKPQKIAS